MTDHARPVDIVVALPAHDEQDLIGDCLASVIRAVDSAQRSGVVRRARVAVAAHRCTDDTADQARSALALHPEVEGLVRIEREAMPVGSVRTRLVNAAVAAAPSLAGGDVWIFNTDADTLVPADWITATLRRAREQRADLILGLADLAEWPVDRATREAYERIVADGLTGTGHQHAYAANLAIRLTAFQRVGGFPALPHGEEHGLAAACRAADLTVISTLFPRVQTSARMPGRAAHGLGALLARLVADEADPSDVSACSAGSG